MRELALIAAVAVITLVVLVWRARRAPCACIDPAYESLVKAARGDYDAEWWRERVGYDW